MKKKNKPFYTLAPECHRLSQCSVLSDMFSCGLVICAIYNHGRSLLNSNYSPSTYLKQLDAVSTVAIGIINATSSILYIHVTLNECNRVSNGHEHETDMATQ